MSRLTKSDGSKNQERRQKRHVLSEEEYTSTLSDIIQRDYYSDIPDLQRQIAVLDRRSVGDIAGAIEIRRAARQLEQHEQALADLEHQHEHEYDTRSGTIVATTTTQDDGKASHATFPVRKVPRPLHREDLTGFHARVTSEDNAEFEKTQKEERRTWKENVEKLLLLKNEPEQTQQATSGNDKSDEISEDFLLASDQFNPPPDRILPSQWKKADTFNSLFFAPSANKNFKEEEKKEANGLLLTNDNNTQQDKLTEDDDSKLMPPPLPVSQSSALVRRKDQSSHNYNSSSDTSSRILPKESLVEYRPKHTLEKTICPANTRFPKRLPPILEVRRGERESTEDSYSSFTEYDTTDDASTDLDVSIQQQRPIHVERKARMEQQKREQETFVSMTPLIVPGGGNGGAQSSGNDSPIVTWGTVSGTPLIIGGKATGDTNKGNNSHAKATASHEAEDESVRREKVFEFPAESDRDKAAQKAQAAMDERKARATTSAGHSGSGSVVGKKRKRTRSSSESVRCMDNASSCRSIGSTTSSKISRRTDRASSSLTPAAMSLMEKTSNSNSSNRFASSARAGNAFASALRSSYSAPGHGRNSSSRSIRSVSSSTKATPRIRSNDGSVTSKKKSRKASSSSGKNPPPFIITKNENNVTNGSNITDGLLKLP